MTAIASNKKFLLAACPLFLILFIDSMGLGLIVPILNAIIILPNSTLFSTPLSSEWRNIIFGSTMGIFMLCWFFGASFLGDLSDQIGRKKSLMICLLGAFFGYLLSAIGVSIHNYWLLLIGRMIAGFTAGSQSIAQAAIVDISIPEHKARNLGLILFFTSIGFIFGPLIGDFFSNEKISSWFNYSTPLYFAAFLALLNTFLLWLSFHETFYSTAKAQIKLHRAIEIFISAFKHPKVCKLAVIFLIMIFGWASFYSFISMFLTREYNFTPANINWYMALMGAGFGIGTGFLVEYLSKLLSLRINIILNLLIAAIAALITLIAPSSTYAWFCVVPLATAVAIVYSMLLTIFSNQVAEDSQGWIMGITGGIMAFGFGINGILVGLLSNFSPRVPLIITVAGLVVSAVLMYLQRNDAHEEPYRVEKANQTL